MVLELADWVRRSVRLYYWKQWKQPRTRRRHLIALGANPAEVKMATRSRKGYWRMSSNRIVQQALSNRWLEEQGVPTCEHYGLDFTTGGRPGSDRNRRTRTGMSGGVGPVAD